MVKNVKSLQEIARSRAYAFMRRIAWAREHFNDMCQEALIALLRAQETHRANIGSWDVYSQVAADRAIRRYLHRVRTAVVPPRLERGGELLSVCSLAPAHAQIASDQALASERLDVCRVRHRVRVILRAHDKSHNKLAVGLLLDEIPAKILSKQYSIPVRDIYRARTIAVSAVKQSRALKRLWNEVTL